MKTNLKEILDTQKKGWLKEDLVMVLKKTRQEPGLSLVEITEAIREALGDDTENLMNTIERTIVK